MDRNTQRNPFAVRNNKIILIEDLHPDERGLKCKCKCPACDGDFIARMGDVKVHHFAHSKDACDEVRAYTSGLYRLIHQILAEGHPFYLPALVITYKYNRDMDEYNVGNYVELVREDHDEYNYFTRTVKLANGKSLVFDHAELCADKRNFLDTVELTYKNSKMAIKVLPPDTVCKLGKVSPHNALPTLVLDFTGSFDKIQTSTSDMFKQYLLSEHLDKYWISNPRVSNYYMRILAENKKFQEDRQKYLKRKEEVRRNKLLADEKRAAEERRAFDVKFEEIKKRIEAEEIVEAKRCVEMERLMEIKRQRDAEKLKESENYKPLDIGMFNQQKEPIYDSRGSRWVKCELCGEIKPDNDFVSYGGADHVIPISNKTYTPQAPNPHDSRGFGSVQFT